MEHGITLHFCEYEGEAISRADLLDSVWGYDYLGGSNVVEARIRALGKKMGDHAHLIETVPGVGYRFRRG